MKNQRFGFTLIELLVVIVIIGILATISTATFSGYFRKARDTERQTFVRNAQQILIAEQVSSDTPNYSGYTTATITTALETQGYGLLDEGNSIEAYFISDATASSEFLVVVCKEDTLATASTVNDVFSAGTAPLEIAAAPTGTTTSFSMTAANLTAWCTTASGDAAPVLSVGNSTTNNTASVVQKISS